MAKFISILMSCVIMTHSINIDLVDIIQLDEFIEHAQFHSEKYEDNFFVFISKHYGELKQDHNQQHQEEQPKHEKLPFEHQSSSQYASNTFVLLPADQLDFKPEVITDNSTNFFYQESFSSFEKQKIFQPPQNS